MLDLDTLRDAYAQYLHDHTGRRHSMDGALMHACTIAYHQGMQDASDVAPPAAPIPPVVAIHIDGKTLPITAAGTDFRTWSRTTLEQLAADLVRDHVAKTRAGAAA